jgi:hypothetical protein
MQFLTVTRPPMTGKLGSLDASRETPNRGSRRNDAAMEAANNTARSLKAAA